MFQATPYILWEFNFYLYLFYFSVVLLTNIDSLFAECLMWMPRSLFSPPSSYISWLQWPITTTARPLFYWILQETHMYLATTTVEMPNCFPWFMRKTDTNKYVFVPNFSVVNVLLWMLRHKYLYPECILFSQIQYHSPDSCHKNNNFPHTDSVSS